MRCFMRYLSPIYLGIYEHLADHLRPPDKMFYVGLQGTVSISQGGASIFTFLLFSLGELQWVKQLSQLLV